MYDFTSNSVEKFFQELNLVVPIRLVLVNDLGANASFDFDPRTQSVVIRYLDRADENIDILHELIHVEMFFRDDFCQLAWPTNDPLATGEVKRIVFHIRNIVDDTYVFHCLYERFGVFPISPIFLRACRRDRKKQKIQLMESEIGLGRILAGAWRLRMAELCTQSFGSRLASSQRGVCCKFLETFSNKASDVDEVLAFLRSSVTPTNVRNAAEHSEVLLLFRDFLGLSPEIVYLARYQKNHRGFSLAKCKERTS
jgi:hypothetical protein